MGFSNFIRKFGETADEIGHSFLGDEEGSDKAKRLRKQREAEEIASAQRQAEAAKAAEEKAVTEQREFTQRELLKRKGRRASILATGQGVSDPLGLPG